MDFGKYKKALRAATRPTHLRRVVYDPNITDTDVDFPDIENPHRFAGGGAVKIIKRILSADGLRRLAKKEGIPEKDVEKFLSGEYGILKRDQARGVVKRDKDGNIVVQDKYSEKYDPIRKQMLKDDPGMFDDIFDRMFSEYQYDMYKKSGRKPNSEGGLQREDFGTAAEFVEKAKQKGISLKSPRAFQKGAKRFVEKYDIKTISNPDNNHPEAKLYDLTALDNQEKVDEILKAQVKGPAKKTPEIKKFIEGSAGKLRRAKQYSKQKKIYSSPFVEKILEGTPQTVKSHMTSLKNQFQSPEMISYAPAETNVKFNKVIEKEIDQIIKTQNDLLEEKPRGWKSRFNKLNEYGIELSAASGGEKGFSIRNYDGSYGYTFGAKTGVDTGDIFKGMTMKDIEAIYKKKDKTPDDLLRIKLFEQNKEDLFKNIEKKSKPRTSQEARVLVKNISAKLRDDAGLQQAALTKYPVCKGRKEGGDLATCIAENLIKDAKKIETGNSTQRMVAGNRFKDIVRKGGRRTKDGLRVIQKGLSAGVGGGLGLALEGILEALLVGWDMSANAAPLDEALQANTILASGAVEFLPEGELKESLGGGLISGPSAERLKIEKAIEGNPAAERYDQAKQALDEYNSLKGQVEQYSTAGEDSLAYREALQKFNDLEEELTFLGDMDEYKRILTPGSYESNEYKRVMTEQASERTGQAYRDRELGMDEGLVDPAAVEQARAEEFKDQTEMIYGNDMTEEEFMRTNQNKYYEWLGEHFNKPGLKPGQDAEADRIVPLLMKQGYKNNLKLFEGIRRQEYSGGGLTRRAFLKLVGGLSALGVGLKSGLVKLKSTVAKQTLENAPKGTPDWFAPLVDKIKTQGKDMSDTLATIERESVTVLKVPVLDKLDQPIKVQRSKSGVTVEENVSDTYTLYENPDTGEISVRVDSDAGVNNMPVDFNMTPTRITGTTDEGKPIVEPGEFVVVEERAVGRQVGPDDYDIDLDEYVTNDLDDAASDWHSVEEFATGKTDKTAQTKKRVIKDAIENDPGEDVISRQGELLDYDQGDDYD